MFGELVKLLLHLVAAVWNPSGTVLKSLCESNEQCTKNFQSALVEESQKRDFVDRAGKKKSDRTYKITQQWVI